MEHLNQKLFDELEWTIDDAIEAQRYKLKDKIKQEENMMKLLKAKEIVKKHTEAEKQKQLDAELVQKKREMIEHERKEREEKERKRIQNEHYMLDCVEEYIEQFENNGKLDVDQLQYIVNNYPGLETKIATHITNENRYMNDVTDYKYIVAKQLREAEIIYLDSTFIEKSTGLERDICVVGSSLHLEAITYYQNKIMYLKENHLQYDPITHLTLTEYEDTLEELTEVSSRGVGDLFDTLSDDIPYLIDGVIVEDAMGEIFGTSGHHKTFLILQMLFCIAHGIPFHGREVKQGKVVYMAGEGHSGLKKRLNALCEYYDVELDRKAFLVPDISLNLMDEDSVKEFGVYLATKGEIKMLVIDTLVSYTNGMDMNGDVHWNSIKYNIVQYIKPYVQTVSWITHTGLKEQKRAKGSSQRYADSDYVLQVQKSNTNTSLIYHKNKDRELSNPIKFIMKHVGDSLVPVQNVTASLTKKEKMVMDLLGKDIVTYNEFKNAADTIIKPNEDKSSSALRMARKRLRDGLEQKNVLVIIN